MTRLSIFDKNLNKKDAGHAGFTLIEILVSIGILTLLLSLSMTVFKQMTNQQMLDKDVENVVSTLIRAKALTIGGERNLNYGVHFASTTATQFQGKSFVNGSSTNLVQVFNNRTYMDSINLSGGAVDVYFNKISGTPNATGTIIFKSTGITNKQKLINIYGTGLVEVQ
jgi:prepilin-type N-terminal cleavage/methylation domain-containing protein